MNELLNKVSQFFSKDILFASLLPALLFIFGVFIVLASILGFSNIVLYYGTMTANAVWVITFVSLFLIIIFSYVLYSIRGMMIDFWSGNSFLLAVYFRFVQQLHLMNFDRKQKLVEEAENWSKVYAPFVERFEETGDLKPDIPKNHSDSFTKVINNLKPDQTKLEIENFFKRFLVLHRLYSNLSLEKLRAILLERLQQWVHTERSKAPEIKLLSDAYQKFKTSIVPVKGSTTNLPIEEEMEMRELMWAVRKQPNDADVDRLFTRLGDSCKKYSDQSIRSLLNDIVALINDSALSKIDLRSAGWSLQYQKFAGEMNEQANALNREPIDNQSEAELINRIQNFPDAKPKSADIKELLTDVLLAIDKFDESSMKKVLQALQVKNMGFVMKTYKRWIVLYENFSNYYKNLKARPKFTGDAKTQLIKRIKEVKTGQSKNEIEKLLNETLAEFVTHARSSMNDVYRELEKKDDIFKSHEQRCASELDRSYGSRTTVKGTRLGNIIQAYHEYSFERYRIEAEIFWPRLQKVMTDKEYNDSILDQKITLDFSITCASLSAFFSFLCLFGPLIYNSGFFWIAFGAASLFIGFLSYQMAVRAAEVLGQSIRSSYDLYRLKLLKALNLKTPLNTDEERELWTAYSQFVVYGDSPRLELSANDSKP